MTIKNNNNQGFTLIEIAMVVIIFSMLMNLFGYGLLAYQKKQKYVETKIRIAAIEKAIDEFLEINARLPCVAPLNLRPGQAGFGAEASGPSAAGEFNCRFGIGGTLVYQQTNPPVGGAGPHWNRVGSVPVRTLNLPDDYIVDAWGSRFTYVVSERQSSEITPGVSMYLENSGANNFDIIDQDPNNQRYPGFNNFAEYVVISHGEDKKGGPSLSNGLVPLVPCVAAEPQGENCLHNSGARQNIVISEVISDNGFDDIIAYKAGTNRNEILPSGAVIGFDEVVAGGGAPATGAAAPAAGCPPGWVAPLDARGKFIMGTTTNGVPTTRLRRSNSVTINPAGSSNYLNLGQTGEDADETVPPYVTTLFCEKQ